jgi:type VII secretion-associated protein (TIGR03931 family)
LSRWAGLHRYEAAVSAHRTVIEAGPGAIRRLCCGTGVIADAETASAALGSIDDPVALVDGHPVAVDSLWRTVLRSLDCGSRDGVIVVHPSWWSVSRVGVVTAAARTQVVGRPRSWLLRHVVTEATVVEIAERLVAITGDEVVAVPRVAKPGVVAEEVAGVVAGTRGEVVLIDAPKTVAAAAALARLIASAVRASGIGRRAVQIDDARLPRLARTALSVRPVDAAAEPRCSAGVGGARSGSRRLAGVAAAGVVLASVAPAVVSEEHAVSGRGVPPPGRAPTTFLVEGRVALTVPASWPTQRVVAGPGSARVQVTSPLDPEVALHVTQSAVPGETLNGTAERLKRAVDAEPAGVFVDLNPSGSSAGKPAVTYREVRTGHHVKWAVWVDGAVRISVGCQSRPGREEAVREVCDEAVRSAHAIG